MSTLLSKCQEWKKKLPRLLDAAQEPQYAALRNYLKNTGKELDLHQPKVVFIGRTGAGKSTLINNLLNITLPTGDSGSTTAAPLVLTISDDDEYEATITPISSREWKSLRRRYQLHLKDPKPLSQEDRQAIEHVFLPDQISILSDAKNKDTDEVVNILRGEKRFKFHSKEECLSFIEQYCAVAPIPEASTLEGESEPMVAEARTKCYYWPLMARVEVKGSFGNQALAGLQIMDIPGNDDSSELRKQNMGYNDPEGLRLETILAGATDVCFILNGKRPTTDSGFECLDVVSGLRLIPKLRFIVTHRPQCKVPITLQKSLREKVKDLFKDCPKSFQYPFIDHIPLLATNIDNGQAEGLGQVKKIFKDAIFGFQTEQTRIFGILQRVERILNNQPEEPGPKRRRVPQPQILIPEMVQLRDQIMSKVKAELSRAIQQQLTKVKNKKKAMSQNWKKSVTNHLETVQYKTLCAIVARNGTFKSTVGVVYNIGLILWSEFRDLAELWGFMDGFFDDVEKLVKSVGDQLRKQIQGNENFQINLKNVLRAGVKSFENAAKSILPTSNRVRILKELPECFYFGMVKAYEEAGKKTRRDEMRNEILSAVENTLFNDVLRGIVNTLEQAKQSITEEFQIGIEGTLEAITVHVRSGVYDSPGHLGEDGEDF